MGVILLDTHQVARLLAYLFPNEDAWLKEILYCHSTLSTFLYT